MDLLTWASGTSIPHSSDARPKKVRFRAETLKVPTELDAATVHVVPGSRRPNGAAISIDTALITTQRAEFRALGLTMIGYALSDQNAPARIRLHEADGSISQMVIWPSLPSSLEATLGIRQRVHEVHYRPQIFDENPDYTTTEQDDETYPREHLPRCSIGSDGVEPNSVVRPGEPRYLHIEGTAPSLVWLGKFLLNLSLEDCRCTTSYLYNYLPAESLAVGSAELRLMVAGPSSLADHETRSSQRI